MKITVTHIDTACVLLDINGFRILTDPTLDGAGHWYHHGFGSVSRKTGDPSLPVSALPPIDLVLLSHHQHKDNFDNAGKAFARSVAQIVSTTDAALAMPGITGLAPWETRAIATNKVLNLRITATPAQHHPWWVPEFLSGKVIGFVIEFDGQSNGVLYLSGDTVYFSGIDEVARRYTIDTGIFNVGSVQFRYLTGFGQFTMDSKGLLKAVNVLQPRTIIPVHYKGWSHFKEAEATLRKNLAAHKDVQRKTLFLVPGEPTEIS